MLVIEPKDGRDLTRWSDINWTAVEANVRRLQGRIYRATVAGEHAKVKNLQKLLVRSMSAKLLAIRRITQENQGKHTAGIDGVVCATPEARLSLLKARYFRPDGYWTFHDGRAQLYRHAATPITRYVKVSGRATPMDPTQRNYWAERRERQLARVTHQKERVAMLQAQANACALCGIAFCPGDPIDAHHLRPRQAGGGNEWINRVLVHRWCHHAYHQRHGYKVAEARAV
jgi:5-methylcytosine-specific restriction endonuclease McrA